MDKMQEAMIAGGTHALTKDQEIKKLQEENEKLKSEIKILQAQIKKIDEILKED